MAVYKFEELLKKHNVTENQVTSFGSDQSIKNSLDRMEQDKKVSLGSRIKETVGDFTGIGKDIAESSQRRADNIGTIRTAMESGEQSGVRSVLQTAGQVAGAGADAIGAVFKGAVNMTISDKTEKDVTDIITKFGAKVMANPEVQGIVNKYNNLSPEQQRDVDALGGVVALVSEFIGVGVAGKGAKVAQKGVTAGIDATKTVVTNAIDATTGAIKNTAVKMIPKSPEMMNKVARLTPTQARKFKELAGETHGEYLTKTGNFGTPDKIVETEAIKFAQSVKSVDDTLATLPGSYKAGVIDDVLQGLEERVVSTSSKNVPSPISSKVSELIAKNQGEGLNMADINEMKRLYEREVKLGYNKMLNPDKVQTATNVDNALREWQVTKAEELGFTNLKELNKQTQISRNLINSLGGEVVGKTGLNNVSLTDWIMLSGGDPTAVAGFLTKKFFGSKNIQAKIAEKLSKVKPEGIKKPVLIPSKQTPPPQSKIELKKALPKVSPKPAPKSSKLSPKGQGENPTTNSAKEAVAKGLTEDVRKAGGVEKFIDTQKNKFIKEQGFEPSSIKVVDEWFQAKQTQPFVGIGGQNPGFFTNKPTLSELPKSEISKYLEFTADGKAIYYRGIPKNVKTRAIRWGDFISPNKGKAKFYGEVERYELDPKYVKQLGDLEAVYFNPADKLKAPPTTSFSQLRTEYQKALKANKK